MDILSQMQLQNHEQVKKKVKKTPLRGMPSRSRGLGCPKGPQVVPSGPRRPKGPQVDPRGPHGVPAIFPPIPF